MSATITQVVRDLIMPAPDSEDGEQGEASIAAARPHVVDRAHPWWAEVDAEQRERLGLHAGEGGRL
jgi:hypothetical protein